MGRAHYDCPVGQSSTGAEAKHISLLLSYQNRCTNSVLLQASSNLSPVSAPRCETKFMLTLF